MLKKIQKTNNKVQMQLFRSNQIVGDKRTKSRFKGHVRASETERYTGAEETEPPLSFSNKEGLYKHY